MTHYINSPVERAVAEAMTNEELDFVYHYARESSRRVLPTVWTGDQKIEEYVYWFRKKELMKEISKDRGSSVTWYDK